MMDFHFSAGNFAIVLAILTHGASWIWFASKMASKVDGLVSAINRLDKELEKRDQMTERIWERIDEVRDMIPTIKEK
jgi:hypothetical protein